MPQLATAPPEVRAVGAWTTLRTCGGWSVAREGFARFRYGDGFSHSRALALQLCLAVFPLVIAVVGLSAELGTGSLGRVLRQTLLSLTPGASDPMLRRALSPETQPGSADLALWLGLAVGSVALVAAMGQVERGANRIYGIGRDRPTVRKYGRALLMAAGAGLPAVTGFVLIVSAAEVGKALERVYGVDDELATVVGWPAGVAALLLALTLMLRYSPHRVQPGWSWLAVGAGSALVLWTVFTAFMAAYLQLSPGLGTMYGPLTGVVALLLWAQLTSAAVFLGVAFAAQLEECRTVHARPGSPPSQDRDQEGSGTVAG